MKTNLQYNKIIKALQSLHKKHPTYNMGRHIATALDGYPDVWGFKSYFRRRRRIIIINIIIPTTLWKIF
jgi:hypothetical protein